MRLKGLIMIAMAMLIAAFWMAIAETSASDSPDYQALIGRWEGSARGTNFTWSSNYALEIFAIDTKTKKVFYRGFCPECRDYRKWYTDRGKLLEGKTGFQTPDRPNWSGITFELKGDRLNGSATSYSSHTTAAWYYDYSLKRVKEEKRIFEPRELIGLWRWVHGSNWFELTISEVDAQSKTIKGSYKIGRDETEHDLSNAKFIISEDGRLKIDFETVNNTLRYQLTFYPAFGEYPPVLWGKRESIDGNIVYPMFEKR